MPMPSSCIWEVFFDAAAGNGRSTEQVYVGGGEHDTPPRHGEVGRLPRLDHVDNASGFAAVGGRMRASLRSGSRPTARPTAMAIRNTGEHRRPA